MPPAPAISGDRLGVGRCAPNTGIESGCYNATATPCDWKFTADDLDDLLARLEQPDQRRPRRSLIPTDYGADT